MGSLGVILPYLACLSLGCAAASRLEADYPRILAELGVASHPVVTVRVWQDTTSYYNELTKHFGTRTNATGYLTGPTELRLLAGGNLDTSAVHEFVHAVSLAVNPRFANNPRWYWEAVALYENGEFVISRYGRAPFLRLVETGADLRTVLGVSNAEFEAAWQSFVRQRYLS